MKWPWVSRDRYEDERERSRRLEGELERLREILIPQLRPAVAPLVLTENTDFSKVQPIAGKPTIANVMADANRAAFKASQTPGAKGIARELAESQQKRAVVNGN
jgi:hypothetical protein